MSRFQRLVKIEIDGDIVGAYERALAEIKRLEAENAALKAERGTPNAESVDTMKKYLDTVNDGWEYDVPDIGKISLDSQREGNAD